MNYGSLYLYEAGYSYRFVVDDQINPQLGAITLYVSIIGYVQQNISY